MAWLSTSGGGSDCVGRPGLGEPTRAGESARAFLTVLTVLNSNLKFWCRVADFEMHAILRTYCKGGKVALIVGASNLTSSTTRQEADPGRPVKGSLRTGAEQRESQRIKIGPSGSPSPTSGKTSGTSVAKAGRCCSV